MRGDVPMQDATPIVADQEEDIEGLKGQRLHGEEVGGLDLRCMQEKKGPPGGRRGGAAAIACERRGADRLSQLHERGGDLVHIPGRILRRQSARAAAGSRGRRGDDQDRPPRLFQRQ